MKHLFGIGAFAAVVISVAVACGGTTSPTSPASSAARTASSSAAPGSPSAAPVVTSAPSTTVPASAPAGGPSVNPVPVSHGDPALEALLPATIGGKPMTVFSLTLTKLMDDGGDRESVDAFLTVLGKTEADGSWAAAYDQTNPAGGGINAFKVAGADSTALLAGITALEKSDLGTDATLEPAVVAGKTVSVLSIGEEINDTEWLYGYGDVVFVVHAANEAEAAVFLAALP